MANPNLGHDGNGDGLYNLFDHSGVTLNRRDVRPPQILPKGRRNEGTDHTSYTTFDTDVGGYTLKGHNCTGTSLLGNASLVHTESLRHENHDDYDTHLFNVHNIHDDTTL